MVAADAVSGPGGVILDDRQPLAPFRERARAGQSGGGKIWMQINHPGRQVFAANNAEAMGVTKFQLRRMGRAKIPKSNVSPLWALVAQQFLTKRRNKQYQSWLNHRQMGSDQSTTFDRFIGRLFVLFPGN